MSTAQTYGTPYYGLLDIMKRNGITQEQLAKEIQVDRSTFNLKINRTNGRDFTFSEAMKISAILSESVDNFF